MAESIIKEGGLVPLVDSLEKEVPKGLCMQAMFEIDGRELPLYLGFQFKDRAGNWRKIEGEMSFASFGIIKHYRTLDGTNLSISSVLHYLDYFLIP